PVRIRLQEQMIVLREDLEFIESAGADLRNERDPDAGRAARLHHVARAVPSVEIAHDADALRIRCPHGKARPPHALDGDHMRAELLIDVMMIAFAEEMK